MGGAGKTVSWYGEGLSVVDFSLGRPGLGEMRVVDGMMYGHNLEGRWVELGGPDSIDPASGTTPDEILAVTRADVSGDTLRRISAEMMGLTTQQLEDGSTVYAGTVAAGLVATEAGFKEGEHIWVSRSATWPTTRPRTRPHRSTPPSRWAPTVSSAGSRRNGGPATRCGPTPSPTATSA